MLDGALLDKLDHVARRIRKQRANEPMGGIQVVLCGDFYQVPAAGSWTTPTGRLADTFSLALACLSLLSAILS